MTLRRYAPLALSALALACQPKIDERANATTVEYAQFDPGKSLIPMPNTLALQSFVDGTVPSTVPCNQTGSATNSLLCAFARAGGYAATGSPPYFMPIQIKFLTGTLQSDGSVTYAGSPLDVATVKVAGAGLAPTVGVFEMNGATPIPVAVNKLYDLASGTLTLSPVSGSWTAGRNHVVLVRGGASGVTTTAATGALAYVAMPTHYILREAVLSDRRLDLAENQGLFPGDAAAKMAAGQRLEPLRAAWAMGILPLTLGLYAGTGCAASAATCIDLPFDELVLVQTFQVAPGGTITIGDGTDPADATVAGGAVTAIDAFTLQSSVATATVVAVAYNMTSGAGAVAALFVSPASDCSVNLGQSAADPANGVVPIAFTNWPSVGNVTASTYYVCATTKVPGGNTDVTGGIAAATAFTGTGFTSTGTDTGATITVTP